MNLEILIDEAISLTSTLDGMLTLATRDDLWSNVINPYMLTEPPFKISYDELVLTISAVDLNILRPKIRAWLKEIKTGILGENPEIQVIFEVVYIKNWDQTVFKLEVLNLPEDKYSCCIDFIYGDETSAKNSLLAKLHSKMDLSMFNTDETQEVLVKIANLYSKGE